MRMVQDGFVVGDTECGLIMSDQLRGYRCGPQSQPALAWGAACSCQHWQIRGKGPCDFKIL